MNHVAKAWQAFNSLRSSKAAFSAELNRCLRYYRRTGIVARAGSGLSFFLRTERTLLLYRFCSSKTATALAKAIDGLQLLKAPVGATQLRRECLVQLNTLHPRNLPAPAGGTGPIPERLYNADQLVRLTQAASAVECECPQHMAGLLQSLSAFETYSQECEDRNPEDALLHAFLHRSTAHVRRLMEEALRHLVRVEGIRIE